MIIIKYDYTLKEMTFSKELLNLLLLPYPLSWTNLHPSRGYSKKLYLMRFDCMIKYVLISSLNLLKRN
jgi:hypothetical protein